MNCWAVLTLVFEKPVLARLPNFCFGEHPVISLLGIQLSAFWADKCEHVYKVLLLHSNA